MRSTRSRSRAIPALGIALLAAVAWGDASLPAAERAERLARTPYVEGIPYESALAVEAAGAARLAELLSDPEARESHANALLVLGLGGWSEHYASVAGYTRVPPGSELTPAEWRAQQAARLALGHLARRDARALRWLLDAVEDESVPAWSAGRLRGERLAAALRESAITGLALSGSESAEQALLRLAPADSQDEVARERLVRHVAEARRLRAAIAVEGADAVLSRPTRSGAGP